MHQNTLWILGTMILASAAFAGPGQELGSVLAGLSDEKMMQIMSDSGAKGELRTIMNKLGVEDAVLTKAFENPATARQLLSETFKRREGTVEMRAEVAKIVAFSHYSSAKSALQTSDIRSSGDGAIVAKKKGLQITETKAASKPAKVAEASHVALPANTVDGRAISINKELDLWIKNDEVDTELARLAQDDLTHDPKAAALLGDGVGTKCAQFKPATKNNYLAVFEAAAHAKGNSFVKLTAASDKLAELRNIPKEEAKADVCKLAQPPCYLFAGPIAEACQAGL